MKACCGVCNLDTLLMYRQYRAHPCVQMRSVDMQPLHTIHSSDSSSPSQALWMMVLPPHNWGRSVHLKLHPQQGTKSYPLIIISLHVLRMTTCDRAFGKIPLPVGFSVATKNVLVGVAEALRWLLLLCFISSVLSCLARIKYCLRMMTIM